MESNQHFHEPGTPDRGPSDAAALLNDLAADRALLAGRLAAPGWLYPAFGALTALYVASPAIEPDSISRPVVGLAMASTIALAWAFQRISGVRVSRAGASARLTLGVLLCAILMLLSTSFGLASFGLYWWIALPVAVSFGLTVILGRLFDRQYREKVRRGR
jgi:hypothetical protein